LPDLTLITFAVDAQKCGDGAHFGIRRCGETKGRAQAREEESQKQSHHASYDGLERIALSVARTNFRLRCYNAHVLSAALVHGHRCVWRPPWPCGECSA